MYKRQDDMYYFICGEFYTSIPSYFHIRKNFFLKPAQMLETKISSLFLEKSFPVLLEFLPH